MTRCHWSKRRFCILASCPAAIENDVQLSEIFQGFVPELRCQRMCQDKKIPYRLWRCWSKGVRVYTKSAVTNYSGVSCPISFELWIEALTLLLRVRAATLFVQVVNNTLPCNLLEAAVNANSSLCLSYHCSDEVESSLIRPFCSVFDYLNTHDVVAPQDCDEEM